MIQSLNSTARKDLRLIKLTMGLLFLATLTGRAESLAWNALISEIKVAGPEKSVTAVFTFKNAGARPVGISSIRPSCDCLTPRLGKKIYEPGESGELRVEFALGGRAGRQEKSVTIISDDAPDSPTVLRLVVDIPEPVAISPKFVFWRVDEPLDEKVVQITLADPGSTSMGEIQSSEPSFSVRMEAAKGPGQYRVFIRPTSTTKPVQVPIRLSATVGGPKVYVIFAAVK